MKLGTLCKMESFTQTDPIELPLSNIDPKDIPVKALNVMEPTMSKSEKVEVFPDISIPDQLTIQGLKSSNESIEFHSELAGVSLELLQSSLDIVREDDSGLSGLGVKSIRAHLRSIESTFPETKSEAIAYLDDVTTSDEPEVVVMVAESLVKTMGSLRPIVTRGLAIAGNIHKFLEGQADLNQVKVNLTNSKTMLTRGERIVKDGQVERNLMDHSVIFPKVVKAVQAGYSFDEIPDNIGVASDGETKLSTTAVAAIYAGIKKLPLDQSREIDGRDIGTLISFIDSTKAVQKLTTELMSVVVQSVGQGQVNDQVLMNASQAINQATDGFRNAIIELGKRSVDQQQAGQVSAEFSTMPGGSKIMLLTSGKVFIPTTDGETSYGFIEPEQLPDVIDACITKLLPAIASLKEQSSATAQKSIQIAKLMETVLSDKLKMTDTAGTAFQVAFTKFVSSLKFSNSMATIAVETSLNVCAAVIDISRGIGIIVET